MEEQEEEDKEEEEQEQEEDEEEEVGKEDGEEDGEEEEEEGKEDKEEEEEEEGPLAYKVLLYTTQVNSTYRVCWLGSSEVISQVLFTSEQLKKKRMAFVVILSQIKLLFWAASYSACVVYTIIIHSKYFPVSDWFKPHA